MSRARALLKDARVCARARAGFLGGDSTIHNFMGYSNDKGKSGEYKVADFLNEIFGEFNYPFIRFGGVEKNKKVFAGDVGLDPRCKNKESCILFPYFIESKKKANINFWADAQKANDDAQWFNKRGYILFVQKQERGSKVGDRRLAVMSWETFGNIARELQGFIEENNKGRDNK